MREVTYYCDRCGDEIETDENDMRPERWDTLAREIAGKTSLFGPRGYDPEMCFDCMNELADWWSL